MTSRNKMFDGERPRYDKICSGLDLKELAQYIPVNTTDKVLDVGTGYGLATEKIAPHVSSVVAIDVNEHMLREAKTLVNDKRLKNVKISKRSAENLPYPDKSFDKVICRHTLRHVNKPAKALCELHRVLKDKGVLYIADTFTPDKIVDIWTLIALGHTAQKKHYWSYSTFMHLLRDSGFKPYLIKPIRQKQKLDDWIPEDVEEAVRIYIKKMIFNLSEEAKKELNFSKNMQTFYYEMFAMLARK